MLVFVFRDGEFRRDRTWTSDDDPYSWTTQGTDVPAPTVSTEGGTYTLQGPASLLEVQPGPASVDANGTTAVPGLIDSQVHIAFGDYTPKQQAVGFLESYVHGGVTTAIGASEVHVPGRPKDPAGVKGASAGRCPRPQPDLRVEPARGLLQRFEQAQHAFDGVARIHIDVPELPGLSLNLATAALIVFAPDDQLTFDNFAHAYVSDVTATLSSPGGATRPIWSGNAPPTCCSGISATGRTRR